jgi:lipid-A-disaccharide synthase
MSRKFYIIAGETSGDMHGSALVKAIKKIEPETQFKGFGGISMRNEGVEISIDIDKLAVIGFSSVIMNIFRLLSYFKLAKQEIEEFKPDAVILIDYPGFNLRLAGWLHKKGIKVYYYIAPMVWAWGTGRIKKIRNNIDKLFVILPFEEEFFKNHGVDCTYVGNPILEKIESYIPDPEFLQKNNIPEEKTKIAFFPGSRKAEIRHHMKPMAQFIRDNNDKIFLIATSEEFYSTDLKIIQNEPNVRIIFNKNYDILYYSDAGIIKSGTSSLEAVMFRLPHLVIYKTGFINYILMSYFLRNLKYISLASFILGKKVIDEFLQYDYNYMKISQHLGKILNGEAKNNILNNYDECIELIKVDAKVSETLAKKILHRN